MRTRLTAKFMIVGANRPESRGNPRHRSKLLNGRLEPRQLHAVHTHAARSLPVGPRRQLHRPRAHPQTKTRGPFQSRLGGKAQIRGAAAGANFTHRRRHAHSSDTACVRACVRKRPCVAEPSSPPVVAPFFISPHLSLSLSLAFSLLRMKARRSGGGAAVTGRANGKSLCVCVCVCVRARARTSP